MATKLKENASLLDVVMLGAGAAVGSSIFSVLGPAARVAGPMLLAAIAAAVIPMAILAFVYAFVASAAPRSGASYEWPREFIGPRFAFGVAWLRILGSIGFLVTGSLVLTHYLVLLTAFPSTLTMFAILTATYLLNVLGVSFAAKAQSIMMSVLIVTFTIFVVASIPHTRAANVTPLLHLTNVDALLLTLPLLIHLFMGIETATEIGEEVRDAARMIPRGIALSVLLTLAIYLIITITALGVVGLSGMSQGDTPLAGAAKVAGPAAQAVIMVAAILCLVKSLNVNFLIFSRNLFAMARSGVLPSFLARVHDTRGTPHIAATAVFFLSCLGLLLPQDLVYLFVATSIPTLLKYLSSCICAIIIRARHQALVDRAHFRPSRNVLFCFAGAGALCSIGIALIGIATDWRPYVLIGGWAVLGVVYWYAYARRRLLSMVDRAGC